MIQNLQIANGCETRHQTAFSPIPRKICLGKTKRKHRLSITYLWSFSADVLYPLLRGLRGIGVPIMLSRGNLKTSKKSMMNLETLSQNMWSHSSRKNLKILSQNMWNNLSRWNLKISREKMRTYLSKQNPKI